MRTVYQLKAKELAELEKAIRQDKRAEVRQRAMAIGLLHLGHKPEAVAEQQMVSVPTIYNWHKLWREAGIEGLANRKAGVLPRPRKLMARNSKSCWRRNLQSLDIGLPFGPRIACEPTWRRKQAFW